MEPLIRHGEPGLYDQAPQKTLCKKIDPKSDSYILYMQGSLKEDKPAWFIVGEYNEKTQQAAIDSDIKTASLLCE